ncbi:MAG TPA: phage holin family protein [Leptospiraceae bacterium]|nr:phage holin family protein [Leptospiraceae bacterium]HMW06444.1 phage holin family protein [Leptospiraceae bacterium]HMX31532.1 phage holin family protein [Leptospiraceae bacterium]HMY31929.1 phage holin family protein [Leptospiraceae bacterium]HMZ63206.1 phage holin family protein [Leptospiraceae bacterium]
MKKLLVSIVLQVLVVMFLFPMIDAGFRVKGDFKDALIIVIVFIVLNFAARKLILIFTLGIGALVYYLTLGVAGLLLNAVIIYAVKGLFPELISVPNFTAAFLGGLFLAIANYFGGR